MTQLTTTELDAALRKLIADPGKLDEVKQTIQTGASAFQSRYRKSEARNDDLEDMFDNLPI